MINSSKLNISNSINPNLNINKPSTTLTRPFTKLNSRFSASQPFLPVSEPLSVQQDASSNSYKYNAVNKNKTSQKLNNISESTTDDLIVTKSHNSLTSSSKLLMSEIYWSDKLLDIGELANELGEQSKSSIGKRSLKSENNDPLPLIVKVVKGNYGVVKENTSKSSIYNLLVYKKCKFVNVLCQSIKYNADKKPIAFGNKLSIPITYSGWFEVLSEDGKSIKLLNSIKELVSHTMSIYNLKKKSNKPTTLNNLTNYLIRENVNAYSIAPNTIYNKELKFNGIFETEYSAANLSDFKKVSVKTGDKLQIVGDIYLDNLETIVPNYQKSRKLVKCKLERCSNNHDQNMSSEVKSCDVQFVYFFEETKGKFSPIARMENISGVHKLQDILKKFRFPITVQLVYGRAPSSMSSASASLSSSISSSSSTSPTSSASPSSQSSAQTNSSLASKSINGNNNQFSPILRLLKIYEVENLLAYPIGKESCLIQIPLYSSLKVIVAENMPNLVKKYTDYGYLRYMLSECEKLAPEYSNMINYLPQPPPQSLIDNFNQSIFSDSYSNNLIGRAVLVNKSNKDKEKNSNHHSNGHEEKKQGLVSNKLYNNELNQLVNEQEDDKAYKEIDDLYEYVRSGVLPDYIKHETHFDEKSSDNKSQSQQTHVQSKNSGFNHSSNSNNVKRLFQSTEQPKQRQTEQNEYENDKSLQTKSTIHSQNNMNSLGRLSNSNKYNIKPNILNDFNNYHQLLDYDIDENTISNEISTQKNSSSHNLSQNTNNVNKFSIYNNTNSSANSGNKVFKFNGNNANNESNEKIFTNRSTSIKEQFENNPNRKSSLISYEIINKTNSRSDPKLLKHYSKPETSTPVPQLIPSFQPKLQTSATKTRDNVFQFHQGDPSGIGLIPATLSDKVKVLPQVVPKKNPIKPVENPKHLTLNKNEKFMDNGSYYIKLNDYKLNDLTDSLINTDSTSFNQINNKEIDKNRSLGNHKSNVLISKPTALLDDNRKSKKYWYTSIQDLSNYYHPVNNEYQYELIGNDLLLASDNFLAGSTEVHLMKHLNLYQNVANKRVVNDKPNISKDSSSNYFKEVNNSDKINQF